MLVLASLVTATALLVVQLIMSHGTGVTLTLDLQIGVEGIAHLRVALACCPNLHRLDIKVSPLAPYCCFRLGSGGQSCAVSSYHSALHQ